MGIRVVVVDDNPHVQWEGRVYPINATFHRFLGGVFDVPGAPVASIVHCVPLRAASAQPATLPLDPRLEVVGTAPFEGIAGFLRRAPALLRLNAAVLRREIASADLVWIKVPASNAPLAGWLASRAGAPRFGYVAGSALAVARGRGLGVTARAVGVAYDLAGRLAAGQAAPYMLPVCMCGMRLRLRAHGKPRRHSTDTPRITGEPDEPKASRPVRRGADGKVLAAT